MANKTDSRKLEANVIQTIFSKVGVYLCIVVLIVIGSFVNPNFLTVSNFKNVIQASAMLGMVCAGMAFVVYSGHSLDMSVPIIIALAGVVCVDLLPFGIPIAVIGGLLSALVVGFVNGFVVGKFKANPMIWTLGMKFVIDGLIRWLYHNTQIYPDVVTEEAGCPEIGIAFMNLSRIRILNVNIMIYVMIVLLIVAQIVLTRTTFGRQLKIIGAGRDVAKFSGINVTRNIVISYMLCAFTSGIMGVFLASMTRVGAFYNGSGYDFQAITAIVIGGMSLAGGRGNLFGVLGGVITVKLLSNVMTFFGIGTYVQDVITGIVFIIIVYWNTRNLRKQGKDNV